MLLLQPLYVGLIYADSSGFVSTWRLLKHEQKDQFVAGYLHGWQDAAKVTDIAIQFVEENPEKAVEGLVKIKQLYKIKGVKAAELVKEIDDFYSDPANAGAPLSMAVTAARNRTE